MLRPTKNGGFKSSKTDIFINYGDSRRPIECASGMEKMVSSMALRVALGNVSNLNKSEELLAPKKIPDFCKIQLLKLVLYFFLNKKTHYLKFYIDIR